MKTYLHRTPGEEDEVSSILDALEEGAVEGEVGTTLKQKDAKMPKDAIAVGSATTQLATRVPANLYKRIKLFVVESDTSIMEFVGAALATELQKRGGFKGKKAS